MIYAHADFLFGFAIDPIDRDRIFQLRVENYRDDAPYLLETVNGRLHGRDRFDDDSYLFYAKQADRLIATCRLTPRGSTGWEVSGLVPQSVLPTATGAYAQFNRTLVDRRYRNMNVHPAMFYVASEWVLRYTNLQCFFSVCTVSHLRFYAGFGVACKSSEPFPIEGRGDQLYHMVEAPMARTNALLRQRLIENQCLPIPVGALESDYHGENPITCRSAI